MTHITPRAFPSGGRAKAAREWAWSRGMAISSVGAIPRVVVDAFYKAHPELDRIAS